MTNESQPRSLKDELLIACLKSGTDTILDFGNHYTQILAQSFRWLGTRPRIVSVAYGGYEDVSLWAHCETQGYAFESVPVSLQEALEYGMTHGIPHLRRAALSLLASRMDRVWCAIPAEIRITRRVTNAGIKWGSPSQPHLSAWVAEHGKNAHMMLKTRLWEAYWAHPTIRKLVKNGLPGKASNRSSDRGIWEGEGYEIASLPYQPEIANKPYWQQYTQELNMTWKHGN